MKKDLLTIGPLRVYREDNALLTYMFNAGPTITLYAVNDAEKLVNETYFTQNEPAALEAFMLHLDYCTMKYITSHLENVTVEYDGILITGRIPGRMDREYFTQTEDPRFFKHFTHRPD